MQIFFYQPGIGTSFILNAFMGRAGAHQRGEVQAIW